MISSKLEELKKEFGSLSQEELYHKIIAWGKKLPAFDPAWKQEQNLVPGCQSIMYLYSTFDGTHLHFYADSDALISRGLAAILVFFYDGETPEMVITTAPTFLSELGILSSLSPGRANGAVSLYIKMRECALKATSK